MRFILFFILFVFISNCSKPKTVFICGDHVCVNKAEAQQYFEKNLSLEVKIINKNNKKQLDLVELNLEKNNGEDKKIRVIKKADIDKNLKKLSKKEIINIKKNIKKNKKENVIVKKIINEEVKEKEKKNNPDKKISNNNIIKEDVNNKQEYIVDICTILDKCNIKEISKYLLELGKKKDYPDITRRQ